MMRTEKRLVSKDRRMRMMKEAKKRTMLREGRTRMEKMMTRIKAACRTFCLPKDPNR